MANHPNRSKYKSAAQRPPPEAIAAERRLNRMTQRQAAEVVFATESAWRAWEAGDRPMHPGLWELFKVKTLDAHVLRALGLSPNPSAEAALTLRAMSVPAGSSIAFRATSSPRPRWAMT